MVHSDIAFKVLWSVKTAQGSQGSFWMNICNSDRMLGWPCFVEIRALLYKLFISNEIPEFHLERLGSECHCAALNQAINLPPISISHMRHSNIRVMCVTRHYAHTARVYTRSCEFNVSLKIILSSETGQNWCRLDLTDVSLCFTLRDFACMCVHNAARLPVFPQLPKRPRHSLWAPKPHLEHR